MQSGRRRDQSIEDVDRISWEAEMMRAEEHLDSMDEDEDCEEEGDAGWETA